MARIPHEIPSQLVAQQIACTPQAIFETFQLREDISRSADSCQVIFCVFKIAFFEVPVQTVDATPSNELMGRCFR